MYKLTKILKYAVLSSLIIISTQNSVFSANEIEEDNDKVETVQNYKGMGLTLGFLSGLGFTYRQFFADRLGVKASGMGFFDQNQTFGNIGLQGMYVFSENDWLKFYGLLGVSNFSTKRNFVYYPEPVQNNESVYIPPRGSSNLETYNSVGGGIGIELGRLEQGLSFVIELPLVATFKGTALNSFYPIPSVSLIYNFK